MKFHLLLTVSLLLPVSIFSAQKKQDRPKVHAEFFWGSLPPSRDAIELMAGATARLAMVGYHEGWNDEKMSKELKLPARDISETYGALFDRGLLGNRAGRVAPALPVIRDRDLEQLSTGLQTHARDFAALLETRLGSIETALAVLPGAQDAPADRRLFAALVSGILLGSMIDVFAEDKTFMPPPPRRGTGQFYGWLVESDPSMAGKLQRETWDSEGYQFVALSPALLSERPRLESVRRSGFVLEDAEARRFRAMAIVLSRDTLLPFFKTRREEFLKAHQRVDAGKYASFASFFSWYYVMMAQGAVDRLVTAKTLTPPSWPCIYALKMTAR